MKSILIVAALAVAVGPFVLGCGAKKADAPQEAALAAFRDYDAAFRAGNLAAMKVLVTAAKAAELSAPDAAATFELARGFRPATAEVGACSVLGDKATVSLTATHEGTPMKGAVSLARENGAWRVDKEDWSIVIKMAPEPDAEPPPPPAAAMPAAVKAIVDRLASGDPGTGCKAWMELAARYQDAVKFLAEVKPALWDERPIRFVIVEASFSGGGQSFRYFEAKEAVGPGRPVVARTVGEALRYPLWQYEDVSNSGFKGGFPEWWAAYAPKKGLPAFGR